MNSIIDFFRKILYNIFVDRLCRLTSVATHHISTIFKMSFIWRYKMPSFKDITGKKFNRLTAIKCLGSNKHGQKVWLFKCDCGQQIKAVGSSVVNGHTTSCGCYHSEISKGIQERICYRHGLCYSRLYHIWSGIKKRCFDVKEKNYKRYGGRDITVCENWKNDYQSFYDWSIKNGYKENAKRGDCMIDRIDNNGNYCPENCRWITNKEQSRNRRDNVIVEYNGIKKCLSEWAEYMGVKNSTFWAYYKRNGIEKAFIHFGVKNEL